MWLFPVNIDALKRRNNVKALIRALNEEETRESAIDTLVELLRDADDYPREGVEIAKSLLKRRVKRAYELLIQALKEGKPWAHKAVMKTQIEFQKEGRKLPPQIRGAYLKSARREKPKGKQNDVAASMSERSKERMMVIAIFVIILIGMSPLFDNMFRDSPSFKQNEKQIAAQIESNGLSDLTKLSNVSRFLTEDLMTAELIRVSWTKKLPQSFRDKSEPVLKKFLPLHSDENQHDILILYGSNGSKIHDLYWRLPKGRMARNYAEAKLIVWFPIYYDDHSKKSNAILDMHYWIPINKIYGIRSFTGREEISEFGGVRTTTRVLGAARSENTEIVWRIIEPGWSPVSLCSDYLGI